ncbi:MAG: 7,8-didemethyl-8-hydroxy-5-deazariboflavin synthase CofG [Chloroflexi bacterium]|nr:7,8-didemethyl-8-hydroxy-5-deazariboflavin synthase CofG [Chloroflexota bacterium]MCL5274560.1 7,8-didemethyl-8-hydroxy-5-deazariboflavin synthase CofG [Chloroflexota bacterium]
MVSSPIARPSEGVRPHIQELLDRALAGDFISQDDAYTLIQAQETELPVLCGVAATLCNRRKSRAITYSRKVFVPLTTLCRDKCGYCTFVKSPGDPAARTLTPDEVLAIAESGRRAGCKEALFSLGERPELQHSLAREHLRLLGYPTMLAYLRAMCELVLTKTGLLPHANPGTLSREEIADLRAMNVSMGMMLESTSARLTERSQAHFGCPDKLPGVRLATLRAAGELAVPFTTGILIGIGETRMERIDALCAIRDIQAEYGHIQEVIVQNFRAKPGTRMVNCAEPSMKEMMRTLAVARLILGASMNLQAPPNLTPGEYGAFLGAGINDWGGVSPVTPDHINPEAVWPNVVELRQVTAQRGYTLRERLAIYPDYVRNPTRWLDESLRPRVAAWIDSEGLVKSEATQW